MKNKRLARLSIPLAILFCFGTLFSNDIYLANHPSVVYADKKKSSKGGSSKRVARAHTGSAKLNSIVNNKPKQQAIYDNSWWNYLKNKKIKQDNDYKIIGWKQNIAKHLNKGIYNKGLIAYADAHNGDFGDYDPGLRGTQRPLHPGEYKSKKGFKNKLALLKSAGYADLNDQDKVINAKVIDYLVKTAYEKGGTKKLKKLGFSKSDIKQIQGLKPTVSAVNTHGHNADDPHINNKEEEKDFLSKPPDPTTPAGKAAQALFNMFFASGVGKWMVHNAPGETIFAGAVDPNSTAADSDFKPMYVIMKPALSNAIDGDEDADNSSLVTLYKILMPIFIAVGIAALTIVFIFIATKAGIDQVWDPIAGRTRFIKRVIESIICAVAITSLPALISMLLNIDGELLGGFKGLLQSLQVTGDQGVAQAKTAWDMAKHLGIDKYTVQAIRLGSILGGEFSGVIFQLIYLLTYIGLAVYIKFFYFTRAIAFTILMVLGPIFVAFYPTNWGKYRFVNWFRELLGTIYVQLIHAFTLMFMSIFMFTINSQLVAVAAHNATTAHNWHIDHPDYLPFLPHPGSPTQKYSWMTFEVLVMGWIVLMLFRPVSKSLCEMFGISTNMLDNISSYTGGYLKGAGAAAAIAGAGVVGGAANLGASAIRGGASVVGAGLKGTAAAVKRNAKGQRGTAFKKAAMSSLKNSQAKGRFNPGLRKTASILKGAGLNSAGRLTAVGLAAGAGSSPTAASMIGGRIGNNAARLLSKPLSNYALNRADPNQAQQDSKVDSDPTNTTSSDDSSTQRYTPDRWNAQKDPTTNAILSSNNLTDKQKARAIRNLNARRSGVKANSVAGSGSYRRQVQANALNKAVNGQYSNNGDVLSAVNNASGNAGIKNGSSYDAAQLKSNPSYNPNTASNVANKAKAIGFDYSKWQRMNPQRPQESTSAYMKRANNAMNSYATNVGQAFEKASIVAGAAAEGVALSPYNNSAMKQADLTAGSAYERQARNDFNVQKANGALGDMSFEQFKKTPQYEQGFNQFKRDYREEAGAKAGAEVTKYSPQSTSANSAFRSSKINSMQFKDSLSSQLDGLGVPDSAKNSILGSVDYVPGDSLTSKVDTGLSGGNQLVTSVDQGLYNKLNEQHAYTMNNSGISPDLQLNPDDFQQMYNPFNDTSGAFGISSGTIGGLSSSVASMLDHGVTDPASANQAYESAYSLMNPSYSSLSQFGDAVGNDFGGNFDDSLSVDQVADMFQPDTEQDVGGLPEGALTLNKSNAYSWLEARDSNGDKYLVGKIAPGDSTLAGGQVVHQDMDLTTDNQIIPRYDALTHKEATPYMWQDGHKIPVSSNMPDLGTLADGQASDGMSYYDRNDYKQMPYASSLEAASAKNRQISYDLFSKDYSAPDIRGDADSAVFTALNNATGQREIISEPYKNTLWDDMQPDSQFILPLDANDDGLSFKSESEPQLITGSSISASDQRNLVKTMQSTFNGARNRQRVRDFINTLMPETETNIRNMIGGNPAKESLTGNWHTYAD